MSQMARIYEWVTVGDDIVCPTCLILSGETDTLEGWQSSGGVPGVRGTICGIHDRCDLMPTDLDETRLQKELEKLQREGFEKLTTEMKAGLKLDLRRGGKVVVLKNFKDIKGMMTVPYETIAVMETLIARWKMQHGTLPKEFFKLADIDKMIKWLRDN